MTTLQTRSQILQWFEAGDVPSADQWADFINSVAWANLTQVVASVKTNFDLSSGSAQKLYTVPTGYSFILDSVLLYNPSGDGTSDAITVDDGGSNTLVSAFSLANLATSKALILTDTVKLPVLSAGEIINGTMTATVASVTCAAAVRGILL